MLYILTWQMKTISLGTILSRTSITVIYLDLCGLSFWCFCWPATGIQVRKFQWVFEWSSLTLAIHSHSFQVHFCIFTSQHWRIPMKFDDSFRTTFNFQWSLDSSSTANFSACLSVISVSHPQRVHGGVDGRSCNHTKKKVAVFWQSNPWISILLFHSTVL